MEYICRSFDDVDSLGFGVRLSACLPLPSSDDAVGPAYTNVWPRRARRLDVSKQIYKADRPLHQIPCGLPLVAGIDILRLFPQSGNQGLRHVVSECSKSTHTKPFATHLFLRSPRRRRSSAATSEACSHAGRHRTDGPCRQLGEAAMEQMTMTHFA